MYRRGVNIPDNPPYDARGNYFGEYLGDAGSVFQIFQDALPPPPPPTVLYVETVGGILGSLTTGGYNILGFEEVMEYGMDYKRAYPYPYGGSEPIGLENLTEGIDFEIEVVEDNWTRISVTIPPNPPLTTNSFSMTLDGLDYDTTYDYRAFILSLSTGATGNIRTITTDPAPPPAPFVDTKVGDVEGYTVGSNYRGRIVDTGLINIVRYADIQYYAVQYRKVAPGPWLYSPALIPSGPLAVNNVEISILNLDPATQYDYRAYMLVDNVAYYGETIRITTPAIPQTVGNIENDGISLITTTSATGSGDINNVGNPPYTVRGIVWSTSPHPTVALSTKTAQLVGSPSLPVAVVGSFSHLMTPLSPSTTYYARAYITNAAGTAYDLNGNDMTFTTATPPPTTFSISTELSWTGPTSGVLHDNGYSGTIRLYNQVGTQIGTRIFAQAVQITTITTFNGLSTAFGPYHLEFDLVAQIDGDQPTVGEIRWRVPPSYTWTYNSHIYGITDGVKNHTDSEIQPGGAV